MPDPLVLHTEEGLFLRQYSSPEDDLTYLKVQNENLEHIAEFGNKIYKTLDEVKEARLNPNGIIRVGIWKEDVLIGEACIASKDGEEAEMGIWITKAVTGHGYATSVMKTLTAYAISKYRRVFAEVDVDNINSINLLRRVGYCEKEPGRVVRRKWGRALVFDAIK